MKSKIFWSGKQKFDGDNFESGSGHIRAYILLG